MCHKPCTAISSNQKIPSPAGFKPVTTRWLGPELSRLQWDSCVVRYPGAIDQVMIEFTSDNLTCLFADSATGSTTTVIFIDTSRGIEPT